MMQIAREGVQSGVESPRATNLRELLEDDVQAGAPPQHDTSAALRVVPNALERRHAADPALVCTIA